MLAGLCATATLSASVLAEPALASSRSQQSALKSFAGQIRNGLKYCEAGAEDTQILLGEVLSSKTRDAESVGSTR